ncbi:hypothetical protein [Escherichia coli]|uniref:hypothetical protein n=1 Tax=Escherichia coli TaxID=562 RepID=UPI000CFB0C3C|nr:hypothetical protein [Escherichia coli]
MEDKAQIAILMISVVIEMIAVVAAYYKKIKNNTCNQANNVDNRNQQEGQDFHKKDFRGERK